MKLTRHTRVANSITGLSADSVSINGTRYTASLVVSAEKLLDDYAHPGISALDLAALAPALDDAPELVLIGCGATQQQLPTALLADFARRGIGIEVMTNDAACRTYNVLVSEDRRVTLVLLLG